VRQDQLVEGIELLEVPRAWQNRGAPEEIRTPDPQIRSLAQRRARFAQGDPADAVFYIQEGKVKVCVTSERGKEAVVALHGPADFFGEGCLTGQPLRLATVSAMTDCVIVRIDKAAMVRTLHDEPKLSEVFLGHMLARKARVEEDLVDQLSIRVKSVWRGSFC
jgi:CRP/FNR family cyclic AMP-dependent transcriptional regulator